MDSDQPLADRPKLRWLGIMSGTSCDGIDVAVVDIEEVDIEEVDIEEVDIEEPGHESPTSLPAVTVVGGAVHPFADKLRRALLDDLAEAPDVIQAARWDRTLAELFAVAARDHLDGVDAVAVSGHTFAHLPDEGCTLQLGSPALVAERLDLPVVSGFRVSDVARGGEGAPLVPVADRILFGKEAQGIAVVNLGGIANLSWLPGLDTPHAEDCGPSNLVLDELIRLGTSGREDLDRNGARALQGRVLPQVLARWEKHEFFQAGAPRSTGREAFGEQWSRRVWKDQGREKLADLLATASALVARCVARSLERLTGDATIDRVLVGGGGTLNQAVMAALQEQLPVPPEVLTAERHGVDSGLREAAAFAILGHECVHRRAGSYPTTTGCERPGVNGVCWWPSGT